MTLAERLKAAREAKNLTQTDLAKEAGVSLRNVSKIEHGHRTDVKLETARKLAIALGCTAEWLVLGTGDVPAGVVSEEGNAA